MTDPISSLAAISQVPTEAEIVSQILSFADWCVYTVKKTNPPTQEPQFDLGNGKTKEDPFLVAAQRYIKLLREKSTPSDYTLHIELFEKLYEEHRLEIINDEENRFGWMDTESVVISIAEKTKLYVSSIYRSAKKAGLTKLTDNMLRLLAGIFLKIVQRKNTSGHLTNEVEVLSSLFKTKPVASTAAPATAGAAPPGFPDMSSLFGMVAPLASQMQKQAEASQATPVADGSSSTAPAGAPAGPPPLTAESLQQMVGAMAQSPGIGNLLQSAVGMLTGGNPAAFAQQMSQFAGNPSSVLGAPPPANLPEPIAPPPPTSE